MRRPAHDTGAMKERPLSTRIPETSSPLSERTLVRHGLGASPALKTSPVDQRQAYTVGYSTPKSYTKEVPPEFFQRVCDADDLWTRTQGAIALLMLWVVWLAGSFCAFWWPYLVFKGYHKAAIATALIMAYPYVVKVKQSPAFIRFILSGAGWFKGGTCLYLEESMKNVETSQSILLCQHPHGLFTYGFIQNGSAARIDARRPEIYVPTAFRHMKPNAVALVEPLLFKIPLIRHFITAFGCARPATKHEMLYLMSKKKPLGLLPGGSEEIILSHHGHERVYIKHRKGFIKYALQHGYTICIGYTFGEADSYRTLDWAVKFRLWYLRRFRVPLFACWGIWWCPLLPRGQVALETVVGNPFQLPKLADPSKEDIDKWHGRYVELLVDLFERNKAKFGYGERVLEIY
ncbi:diacylglycerol acyltransferase family protein [Nannochloropsis gaditana]|uniref:Acyltransferase n=1 Tax=Nannochloropsis gaditana TaxID=72520 RepID=W7TT81_9STRA|nr:diacylglycerol acyltransferase family protein [Nannochloropsis gaditana]